MKLQTWIWHKSQTLLFITKYLIKAFKISKDPLSTINFLNLAKCEIISNINLCLLVSFRFKSPYFLTNFISFSFFHFFFQELSLNIQMDILKHFLFLLYVCPICAVFLHSSSFYIVDFDL